MCWQLSLKARCRARGAGLRTMHASAIRTALHVYVHSAARGLAATQALEVCNNKGKELEVSPVQPCVCVHADIHGCVVPMRAQAEHHSARTIGAIHLCQDRDQAAERCESSQASVCLAPVCMRRMRARPVLASDN